MYAIRSYYENLSPFREHSRGILKEPGSFLLRNMDQRIPEAEQQIHRRMDEALRVGEPSDLDAGGGEGGQLPFGP